MKKSVKLGFIIGGTSLVLGLAGLFWYLGMSNNNKLIAKIPKDAAMVFKADLKSLFTSKVLYVITTLWMGEHLKLFYVLF